MDSGHLTADLRGLVGTACLRDWPQLLSPQSKTGIRCGTQCWHKLSGHLVQARVVLPRTHLLLLKPFLQSLQPGVFQDLASSLSLPLKVQIHFVPPDPICCLNSRVLETDHLSDGKAVLLFCIQANGWLEEPLTGLTQDPGPFLFPTEETSCPPATHGPRPRSPHYYS